MFRFHRPLRQRGADVPSEQLAGPSGTFFVALFRGGEIRQETDRNPKPVSRLGPTLVVSPFCFLLMENVLHGFLGCAKCSQRPNSWASEPQELLGACRLQGSPEMAQRCSFWLPFSPTPRKGCQKESRRAKPPGLSGLAFEAKEHHRLLRGQWHWSGGDDDDLCAEFISGPYRRQLDSGRRLGCELFVWL